MKQLRRSGTGFGGLVARVAGAVGVAPSVEVAEAHGLEDFMRAMPALRQVAFQVGAPIPYSRVGTLLARFNHGGAGPATGTLILAQAGHRVIGFALLRALRGKAMELAWLHAEDDAVVERLWAEVGEVKRRWGLPALRVGYFVRMPAALRSACGDAGVAA